MEEVLNSCLVQAQSLLVVLSFILLSRLAGKINGFLELQTDSSVLVILRLVGTEMKNKEQSVELQQCQTSIQNDVKVRRFTE